MTEILHGPGFLGTAATFATDLTLTLSLLVAGLFTVGLFLAKRKNYGVHKWVQTSAVVTNLILVVWIMQVSYRTYILHDVGGPYQAIFYQVAKVHAAFGLLTLLLGIFVVLRGHELVPKFLRFNNYKLFMRTAYGLYMTTTLLGVALYYTWYVILA